MDTENRAIRPPLVCAAYLLQVLLREHLEPNSGPLILRCECVCTLHSGLYQHSIHCMYFRCKSSPHTLCTLASALSLLWLSHSLPFTAEICHSLQPRHIHSALHIVCLLCIHTPTAPPLPLSLLLPLAIMVSSSCHVSPTAAHHTLQ